jgi:hypothetical protein
MLIDTRENGLINLLFAFSQPYSFYILGAGASYPIIPLTFQLRNRILDRFFNLGCLPLFDRKPDAVFDRVIGDPSQYDYETRSRLDYLYPSAVRAMLLKELCSPFVNSVPHQYKIFMLAYPRSTIFTFNVDRLVRFLSHRHYIIEPHGSLPYGCFRDAEWDNLIDSFLIYGIQDPILPGFQFPEPETTTITRTHEYTIASMLIKKANYIVLIGYSFGLYRGVPDDAESFVFLVEHIKSLNLNLIIVDPRSEQVADLFGAACNPRKCVQLKVSWSSLSRSLLEHMLLLSVRKPLNLIPVVGLAMRRYDDIEEINAQQITPPDAADPRR